MFFSSLLEINAEPPPFSNKWISHQSKEGSNNDSKHRGSLC